ncbi:DUF971 domain-containing protein [Granulicella cerasi]|uniref:DUF971 domain-containing protein n=1 Tax=Granulicella cerasi TaxID=741063 RepID=A0ABW1Z9M6_9BACT|nr:DUF971 domain-containing protein [Granulicella cerasi]
MSHEIKFVSAAEAAREAAIVKLTGAAIQPAKVRVDKTGGTGMEIEWRDGHKSSWSFAWLRLACPCATCNEEREAEGREPGEAKPKPKAVLPMFEAPARPREVTPVGKYALRFTWNDGHEAGLYSWDYLRNVCDEQRKPQ